MAQLRLRGENEGREKRCTYEIRHKKGWDHRGSIRCMRKGSMRERNLWKAYIKKWKRWRNGKLFGENRRSSVSETCRISEELLFSAAFLWLGFVCWLSEGCSDSVWLGVTQSDSVLVIRSGASVTVGCRSSSELALLDIHRFRAFLTFQVEDDKKMISFLDQLCSQFSFSELDPTWS